MFAYECTAFKQTVLKAASRFSSYSLVQDKHLFNKINKLKR